MHHAAMANKKEMMFTLARLGCDWRARAEGIDGATAAFVLCGQHTRTTRQQVRPFTTLSQQLVGSVDLAWLTYRLACPGICLLVAQPEHIFACCLLQELTSPPCQTL